MKIALNIKETNRVEKYPDAWKKCIGTGRLSLALRKDYLDALAKVQNEIGFYYVRGHGLLCDDLGVYREYEWKGKVRIFYNFTYIDKIFDSFLNVGLRPVVELDFMPNQLASGSETVFWWSGNITPPKDYDKWNDLIFNLVQHFIDRYGLDEVLNWPFEVWNEPNLDKMWKNADIKEYFKLYGETVQTIKRICPQLKVGGPSICGADNAEKWIIDFLSFCKKSNTPIDFVSRHSYSSGPTHQLPWTVYQEIYTADTIVNDFKSTRLLVGKSPFPNLPVYITEYNSSYKPQNPIHDTVFQAAYLGKVLNSGNDYVNLFSYWTFSDVFEEEDIPKSLFHGGFGLLTYYQIKKPIYYLFQFFNQMKGKLLFKNDSMRVTCQTEEQRIWVLLWNPVRINNKEINKNNYVNLMISNLDCQSVFIKTSIVNESNGNSRAVWMKLGKPRFPSIEQIRIIKDCSEPTLFTERLKIKNEKLSLNIQLNQNEIRLIEILPVNDEQIEYEGWDESNWFNFKD